MSYSKNEELEFIKSLYDEADKRFKEIYKEQQNNRDALLKELGLILLTYKILDGFMNIKKADRNKESNKFYALIASFAKRQIKLTTAALYEVTNNVVKNTYKFYSYNVNARDIKKIVDSAYKGKHFSKRVWNNEKEVAEYMNEQIKNFIDGKINVNKIKELIEEIYNNNAYEVKRLVDTEISRCSNSAFDKFCREVNVKRVRYNATLDSRLCDDCAQYHDRIFDVKNKIETPRHPLCRCFYIVEE
ncbi:phage head morphogenesis protein [Clostridium botulinum]|uniref:phage minor head protein n=1 Tax=Clostridium botulinum TaxID=1491 RepID=UPI001788BEFB|nr:phage minor head protein [Clostridium botulinum]MBE1302926.1 phage head morphogenesis protein [Clostridium botulinum]